MKEKIPLAIVMIIVSIATSFAVVQAKVSQLEKTAEKNEVGIKEVHDFKTEQRVVNDYIQKEIKENKEELKEVSKGITEILRELKK